MQAASHRANLALHVTNTGIVAIWAPGRVPKVNPQAQTRPAHPAQQIPAAKGHPDALQMANISSKTTAILLYSIVEGCLNLAEPGLMGGMQSVELYAHNVHDELLLVGRKILGNSPVGKSLVIPRSYEQTEQQPKAVLFFKNVLFVEKLSFLLHLISFH